MATTLHKTRRTRGPRPPATSAGSAVPAAKASSSARPLAVRIPAKATLRRQRVQCGKARCRKWHGPYWYAFWREGDRIRSAYIGKDARLAVFLAERDGGDVVDPVVEEKAPRRAGRALPRASSDEPSEDPCVRCGRPADGRLGARSPTYCFPSRAWLKKHPKDTGAGKHTTDARETSHAR